MILQLDIAIAGTIIALISSIVAGMWWVYKLIARFEKLEKQAEHRKEDMKIVLDALLATLDGLIQGGANHDVTKTYDKVREYVINR